MLTLSSSQFDPLRTYGARLRIQSASLRELLQQRLRLLQDRRVEAFLEPAVDWREEVASLGALALVSPEAGEARSRAQFPELGALVACDIQRVAKCLLSRSPISGGREQLAPQPMHLGLDPTLLRRLDQARHLIEPSQPVLRLPALPFASASNRRKKGTRSIDPVARQAARASSSNTIPCCPCLSATMHQPRNRLPPAENSAKSCSAESVANSSACRNKACSDLTLHSSRQRSVTPPQRQATNFRLVSSWALPSCCNSAALRRASLSSARKR